MKATAKVAVAFAFTGVHTGVREAGVQVVDLLDRQCRRSPGYAQVLYRTEAELTAVATAEGLVLGRVEEALQVAMDLFAWHGLDVDELADLGFDPTRAAGALLNDRGGRTLERAQLGDGNFLCRQAVLACYRGLLADPALLPDREGAFQRKVLDDLRALLRAQTDVSVAVRTALEHSLTEAQSRPRQAPEPPASGVVGRQADIDAVLNMVLAAEPGPVSLTGLGGIGKTTLAAAAVRSRPASERFSDGTLWVPVGPRPRVRALLERVGRDLHIDLLPQPDVQACISALRDALFDRRVVLVLDDVWDPEHARPLMAVGDQSRVLVTTRSRDVATSLSSPARTRAVDVLSLAAAGELLNRLVPALAELQPIAVGALCRSLEFHPLALTLAGRLLDADSAVPARMAASVDALLNSGPARLGLRQSEPRLGIDAEIVTLQAVLGLSVERLTGADRKRFAECSVLGGDPMLWTFDEAVAVWECSTAEAETTIRRLLSLGLAERRGHHYWMHALLHDYAATLWDDEYGAG